MNGAQRQMTWEELCDEMVKQRTRAETAEAEVMRLMVLATRYSDERITAEFRIEALEALLRSYREALREWPANTNSAQLVTLAADAERLLAEAPGRRET